MHVPSRQGCQGGRHSVRVPEAPRRRDDDLLVRGYHVSCPAETSPCVPNPGRVDEDLETPTSGGAGRPTHECQDHAPAPAARLRRRRQERVRPEQDTAVSPRESRLREPPGVSSLPTPVPRSESSPVGVRPPPQTTATSLLVSGGLGRSPLRGEPTSPLGPGVVSCRLAPRAEEAPLVVLG